VDRRAAAQNASGALLILSGFMVTMLVTPGAAFAQLSFSLATEDSQLYKANAAQYEVIRRGSTTLFVEKSPSLTIPAEEIKAAIVKSRQPTDDSSYDATFTLFPSGARRVADFTTERVGRLIEVGFGNASLGVPRIVAPVCDGTIQGRLSGLTPEQARTVLAPLGNKVTRE
jgi:preprotein translocase subunit SecD